MQFGMLHINSLDQEAVKPSFQLDPRTNEKACNYLSRMSACIEKESANIAISTVGSILLKSMPRIGDGVNYVTFRIFDILVRNYADKTKKVFHTQSARMVLQCASHIVHHRRELLNGSSNPVPETSDASTCTDPIPAAAPAPAPVPLPPSKRPRVEVALVEAEVVAVEDVPTLDAVHAGEATEVIEVDDNDNDDEDELEVEVDDVEDEREEPLPIEVRMDKRKRKNGC